MNLYRISVKEYGIADYYADNTEEAIETLKDHLLGACWDETEVNEMQILSVKKINGEDV